MLPACLDENPSFDEPERSAGDTAPSSSGAQLTSAPTTGGGATEASSAMTDIDETTAGTSATSVTTTSVTGVTGVTSSGAEATTGAIVDGPTLCGFEPGEWTLTTPGPIDELNSPDNEAEPFLSPDGLTLYFASDRPGGVGAYDSYRATRPALDAVFAPPINNVDLDVNSESFDSKLALSPDGLRGYMASDRAGTQGGSDLWTMSRADTSGPFGPFENLSALNTAEDEYDPQPSVDGLRLYFASGVPLALFVAERAAPGQPFSPATLVEGLAGPDKSSHPHLSGDERVILFESDRPGGAGDSDIWIAMRPGLEAPFGPPTPLPVINSPSFDGEPLLSADGCELLFASSRPGSAGGWDLWRAEVIAAP